MKRLLAVFMAASLLLYPFATYSADYGSQPSQPQQVPPVAQPLVREGDFAMQLAARLNLGLPEDEASAEDMLTQAGVFPMNGWISDYPVTPQIVGQVSDSVASAADAGRLPMSAEDARKQVTILAGEMDLPLPSPGNQLPPGQPSPSAETGPTIDNYYYEQGPPIITYYPPPPAYVYLYDWVPYPVVWFGFSFPGFYICHSFTTFAPARPFGPEHHHFDRGIVTNHILDPATRESVRVAPVPPSGRGRVRPETMLRTESGRTFRNMTEFRHESGRTATGIGPSQRHDEVPMRGRSFGGSNMNRNGIPPRVPAIPHGQSRQLSDIPARRPAPSMPPAYGSVKPAPAPRPGSPRGAPFANIPRRQFAPGMPHAVSPVTPPAPSIPGPGRTSPSGPVLSTPRPGSAGSAVGGAARGGPGVSRSPSGGFAGHGRR